MAYQPKYLGQKPRTAWMFYLACIFFGCLLLLSLGMLLRNALVSRADQAAFRELAALVHTQEPLPPAQAPAAPAEILPETQPSKSPYQVLKEQNPDFAAWLTVPGTAIDYPVMYTPEDTEYYIYRAFDGSDSPSGTPFVGDHGSLDSRKCIIYGHNMDNGTMFHDLLNYLDREFWQENPTFTISTQDGTREYEIFATVQTRILQAGESGLRYYRLEDGVEAWLKKRSLYDTGITPTEEDTIVILSTCAYHTDNGRLAVAGRLK